MQRRCIKATAQSMLDDGSRDVGCCHPHCLLPQNSWMLKPLHETTEYLYITRFILLYTSFLGVCWGPNIGPDHL